MDALGVIKIFSVLLYGTRWDAGWNSNWFIEGAIKAYVYDQLISKFLFLII